MRHKFELMIDTFTLKKEQTELILQSDFYRDFH